MTNREMLTNTNIADLLANINKEIPYSCIMECLHANRDFENGCGYEHCMDCINEWLNSEVKRNEH